MVYTSGGTGIVVVVRYQEEFYSTGSGTSARPCVLGTNELSDCTRHTATICCLLEKEAEALKLEA
jgi:hypothetical protein